MVLANCKVLSIEEPACEGISRVPANIGTLVWGFLLAVIPLFQAVEEVCAKIYALLTKVTLLKPNIAACVLRNLSGERSFAFFAISSGNEFGSKIIPF